MEIRETPPQEDAEPQASWLEADDDEAAFAEWDEGGDAAFWDRFSGDGLTGRAR